MWECFLGGKYRPYDAVVGDQIEHAYAAGETSGALTTSTSSTYSPLAVTFSTHGNEYKIEFGAAPSPSHQLTQVQTGDSTRVRKVRRTGPPSQIRIDALKPRFPRFPTPFDGEGGWSGYGEGATPITQKEMALLSVSQAIRRKPKWWEKVHDDEIVSKWRTEAGTTPDAFAYMIAELQWLSSRMEPASGLEIRFSPVDGVFESDALVPADVRSELLDRVAELEAGGVKDWHPGSDEQVLDLVHPSLYCYVNHRSRIWSRDGKAWDGWIGGGDPEPGAAPESGGNTNPWESVQYQWLPSEVNVSADGVATFESYINNLHPERHSKLYETLESILGRFIPMWQKVLTAAAYPREPRLAVDAYDWWGPDPVMPSDVSDEDAWHDEQYELREQQEIKLPDFGAFVAPSEEQVVDLTDSKLQVIVKLADIRLTPESPEYKGGVWHVEGMQNESIVASGIYYYDSHNISESRLAFREAVCEPEYEPNDNNGVDQAYGLGDGHSLNQERGYVLTGSNKAIAFPNRLQHKVEPFSLVDTTQPGWRKILVFFLCDPNKRVKSTADVPPQQIEWFLEELRQQSRFSAAAMPGHVMAIIASHLDWPMSRQEANQHREGLMSERKVFVDEHTQEVFEREFSLCEH